MTKLCPNLRNTACFYIIGLLLRILMWGVLVSGFASGGELVPRVGWRSLSARSGVDESYSDIYGFVPWGNTNAMAFVDARCLLDDSGDSAGSSLGLGVRGRIANKTVWGLNLFTDHRRTSLASYHQLGFGFELLLNSIETRSNVYLPIGSRRNEIATSVSSLVGDGSPKLEFSQNYLILGRLRNQTADVEQALAGFDFEVGTNLLNDWYFAGDQNALATKAYVGVYGFENPGMENTMGASARVASQAMSCC
ncbi:inverse autotransporter beta domain-containing protein [Neorhodopirellula lusitana]|nr:inverse autotransporter beta domain-containing protein [Neorhodopirellula lusitana]